MFSNHKNTWYIYKKKEKSYMFFQAYSFFSTWGKVHYYDAKFLSQM